MCPFTTVHSTDMSQYRGTPAAAAGGRAATQMPQTISAKHDKSSLNRRANKRSAGSQKVYAGGEKNHGTVEGDYAIYYVGSNKYNTATNGANLHVVTDMNGEDNKHAKVSLYRGAGVVISAHDGKNPNLFDLQVAGVGNLKNTGVETIRPGDIVIWDLPTPMGNRTPNYTPETGRERNAKGNIMNRPGRVPIVTRPLKSAWDEVRAKNNLATIEEQMDAYAALCSRTIGTALAQGKPLAAVPILIHR
jgi:hypothetical protein